jgi:hypothetical protein
VGWKYLFVLFVFILPIKTYSLERLCAGALSSPPNLPFFQKPKVRVGAYNVMSLFTMQAVEKFVPGGGGTKMVLAPARPKEPELIDEMVRNFTELNLDIGILTEVEDKASLDKLNKDYLGDQYDTYLVPGNEISRGMNIAFIVKKSLGLKGELTTHKHHVWQDPARNNQTTAVFVRDLPLLFLSDKSTGLPIMMILGVHFKSKYNRDEDRNSFLWRQMEGVIASQIYAKYEKLYGSEIPLFMAGDFNGDPNRDPELQVFKQQNALLDSFQMLATPPPYLDRITHSYPHKDTTEPTEYSQIDALLMKPCFQKAVESVFVHRHKDKEGKVKPLPVTREERDLNTSDHFPLITDFLTQELWEVMRGSSYWAEQLP